MEKYINLVSNLSEALPYMKEFKNKIFVIKYGGSIQNNDSEFQHFLKDISLLTHMDMKIVIVHGGGKEITSRFKTMGMDTEFFEGYRVTSEQQVNEVEMLLSGKINKQLAYSFNKAGIKAIGLNGKDMNLLRAKKKFITKDNVHHDIGYVGDVAKVNIEFLTLLLNNSIVPIISPIGFDDSGNTYNINADSVASAICAELKAEKLILMTDVDGIMLNKEDKSTLIEKLDIEKTKKLIKEKVISQGMIPKVECCIMALNKGVSSCHIINGCNRHSLLIEILTDKGIGTMIV